MRELFNDGWFFAKRIIENPKSEQDGQPILLDPCSFFMDRPASYDAIVIPHDWLIGDTNNLYQNSVGFYKKTCMLHVESLKKYALRFEAVYMNSAVYVNGSLAGVWKYGYTTFEFDITPFIKDGENEIEVICVYQSPNTRWYSGAGIFRDVYLLTNEDTRIANDGVYFTAIPQSIDARSLVPLSDYSKLVWTVTIETELRGAYGDCMVRHTLIASDGTKLKMNMLTVHSLETKILEPPMGTMFNHDEMISVHSAVCTVQNPERWSCDHPYYYILQTELLRGEQVIDVVEQHVGFRTVHFDSNKGCFINGEHLKIHGVCEHHDFGALGAAFNLTALKRKFSKLKKMGVNSIRTSHNPPAPALLDLADEMGFLVDDECFDIWEKSKTTYDYGNYFIDWHERDVASLVRRDRNHPSLLMWSIGNEIYDTHSGNGYAIAHDLKEIVRRFDFCKNGLVTIGSNYMEWEGGQRCGELLDVVGYNYGERLYADHHARHAHWCIYGSETASTVQSRGVYHFPLSNRLLTYPDQQCSSLGNCSTNWGAINAAWVVTQDRDAPYCAGQYLWTGFDYIGEPTPYFTKNSYFGQLDTAGFEKDTFYEYKAGWVDYHADPFVHLLPNWDYNEGQLIDVRIYSNAPFVELLVNSVSQGIRENNVHTGLELSNTWTVPYVAGIITAIAYDEKKTVIAKEEQRTPGESARIVVEMEESYGDGLYFIDLSTVDEQGTPVLNARSRLSVSVTGDALLVGLDNGDSTDYEQYQSSDGRTHSRRLFSNRLLAIVQTADKSCSFNVTVTGSGLVAGVLTIKDGVIDTFASCTNYSEGAAAAVCKEIPIRKIELVCTETRHLTELQRSVTVRAVIHPANATDRSLVWAPMMLEGVKSDCAKITVTPTTDGEEAVVTAASDGSFRLTCTAQNGKPYPEVISELEFEVSGVGRATRNPYELIEACKCSSSAHPVEISFQGGVFCKHAREWFCFDDVDFGVEGSDTIRIPLFYWDTKVQLEVWEGVPDDKQGTLLLECTYESPSWYNHYQTNTFVLPRRLFGVHEIGIVIKTPNVSLQGFSFERSVKAFAKLNAVDSNSISGDTFTRTKEAVTGIGNNVVLTFDHMHFGATAAKQITICGSAPVDNTIHLKFNGMNGSTNQIVEFAKTDGFTEKTFSITGASGNQTVSFVFLPGSCFDFKWFRFE